MERERWPSYPQEAPQQDCGILNPPHEAHPKGPVRGISLELQEVQCKRRMYFVPDVSTINTFRDPCQQETLDIVSSLGISGMPGIIEIDPVPVHQNLSAFGRGTAPRIRY
ncbi:hypothetical protein AHAS_Ahas06G0193300 [Arachis hypogaea]